MKTFEEFRKILEECGRGRWEPQRYLVSLPTWEAIQENRIEGEREIETLKRLFLSGKVTLP